MPAQLKDTHGAETIFKLKRSTKFEKILGVSINSSQQWRGFPAVTACWGHCVYMLRRFLLLLGLQAYASRAGVDPNSIKLMFEGATLKKEDTPESMDMEDGDVVEVVVQQVRCRPAATLLIFAEHCSCRSA